MGIQIRDCRNADLIRITEIENASFDDPYPYRLFAAFLNDFPEGFRVAVEENTVIGYCTLSRSNQRSVLLISSIAIHPDFRKRGIGAILLEDAIRIARMFSAPSPTKKIVLQVASNNSAALVLYSKFGFVSVRELKNYYGRGRDATEMELAL